MFWVPFLIYAGLTVVSYILMPKPKASRGPIQEIEGPTAEAGKPVSVPFGTVMVKSPNVLWFGDKATKRYEVDA